jgi:hypothetical protein
MLPDEINADARDLLAEPLALGMHVTGALGRGICPSQFGAWGGQGAAARKP